MSTTEERILGAVSLHSLRAGLQLEASPSGTTALLKVTDGLQHASLSVHLDAGAELIDDVDGTPELYIPLLEAAQCVYEEIIREQ